MTLTIDLIKRKIPVEFQEEFSDLISNAVDLLPLEEFAQKFVKAKQEKRPLRIKLGADPSAPDLHLGHSVALRKLRKFQHYGHTVVFIIGDYTARIGDPSGKNSARPRLTVEQVNANAKTYLDQVMRILDPEKTEVRRNSDWLECMSVSQTIELMSKYTVSQMMEREDFHNRYNNETPIYIHEFIYPLMQGYDSVVVKADLEMGGTDQKFNVLVGREMQRMEGEEPQCIMTMPLLVGLDGTHKMSKSLGNYIGISESPQEMFGKSMSIPDDLMWTYFTLATDTPLGETEKIKADLEAGMLKARDVKEELGKRIVTLYHSAEAAVAAADDFRERFTNRSFPENTAEQFEWLLADVPNLSKLLVAVGMAKSARDAQRLVDQRSFTVFAEPDGALLASAAKDDLTLGRKPLLSGTYKLKLGKTRFAKILLK